MKHILKQIHPLAWTIIIGTMFGRLVTSMSIPFLSIYLIRVLEATPTQTGITVAVSSLAGVLVSFTEDISLTGSDAKLSCSYRYLVGPLYFYFCGSRTSLGVLCGKHVKRFVPGCI